MSPWSHLAVVHTQTHTHAAYSYIQVMHRSTFTHKQTFIRASPLGKQHQSAQNMESVFRNTSKPLKIDIFIADFSPP